MPNQHSGCLPVYNTSVVIKSDRCMKQCICHKASGNKLYDCHMADQYGPFFFLTAIRCFRCMAVIQQKNVDFIVTVIRGLVTNESVILTAIPVTYGFSSDLLEGIGRYLCTNCLL